MNVVPNCLDLFIPLSFFRNGKILCFLFLSLKVYFPLQQLACIFLVLQQAALSVCKLLPKICILTFFFMPISLRRALSLDPSCIASNRAAVTYIVRF